MSDSAHTHRPSAAARHAPQKTRRGVRAAALVVTLTTLAFGAIGFGAMQSCTGHLVQKAQADYPKLGRTVHVSDVDLHYVEAGTGETAVVLLHGAFGGLQDFTSTVLAPLSSHHRTIAFDRPGHGYSERPKSGVCAPDAQARLIHEALVALGVRKPIVVGFSFGGAVALAYALAYPDDVAGVVTINAVTREWPGATSWIYYVPLVPLLGDLFVYTLVMPIGLNTAGASIERAFSPEQVPASFASSPLALALRPRNFLANAEDMRGLKDFVRAQGTRYGELRMPLVIVAGDDDEVANSTHHSLFLHDRVIGSELVRIPHCGHQVLYTHPDVVIDAIERVSAVALAER